MRLSGGLVPGNWVGAPPPGSTPGAGYWPLVGLESLPSAANPTGDLSKMAILPFCKSPAVVPERSASLTSSGA